jgi:hypothetical protein
LPVKRGKLGSWEAKKKITASYQTLFFPIFPVSQLPGFLTARPPPGEKREDRKMRRWEAKKKGHDF